MNCQPSFRVGSVPVSSPVLDELAGFAFDAPDGGPGAREGEAAAPRREQPRRRVPDRDIVDVGPRLDASRPGEPVDVRDLAFNAWRAAVPVRAPAGSAERRNYTKALLALLVLQVAVVGGVHLRKRYAEAQVIVVPVTINERSVIT